MFANFELRRCTHTHTHTHIDTHRDTHRVLHGASLSSPSPHYNVSKREAPELNSTASPGKGAPRLSLNRRNSDACLVSGVWEVHQAWSQFDVDVDILAGTRPYTSIIRNGSVFFKGMTILAVMAKGVLRSLL